ncbi:MAG: HAD family hydrolase [Ruminococcus sp.]
MQSLENIMLITDLDGTLLPSSKEISAADAAAISQFRAKGGKFAIATGRTLQAAQRYLNKLKPNIPVILFNGAAIYDPVTEKWSIRKSCRRTLSLSHARCWMRSRTSPPRSCGQTALMWQG